MQNEIDKACELIETDEVFRKAIQKCLGQFYGRRTPPRKMQPGEAARMAKLSHIKRRENKAAKE